jgi:hypothetical protein
MGAIAYNMVLDFKYFFYIKLCVFLRFLCNWWMMREGLKEKRGLFMLRYRLAIDKNPILAPFDF